MICDACEGQQCLEVLLCVGECMWYVVREVCVGAVHVAKAVSPTQY